MEIKDVTSVSPIDGTLLDNSRDHAHSSDASASESRAASSEDDFVHVIPNIKTAEINVTRLRVNDAISAVNVVTERADKISAVFNSLEGIVSQAEGKPPTVTSKLEDEGQQLISEVDALLAEISKRSTEGSADGAARLALEKSVGKALDLISNNRVKGLGLNRIELTNKEAILITSSKLARTRAHFEHLRSSVTQAAKTVRDVSISADVAAVTRDPSITVIRQAEEAAKVTGRTRTEIVSDPVTAIASIGESSGVQIQL